MPAGITICNSSVFFSTPRPLQVAQAFSGTSPLPEQLEHSRAVVKVPRKERRASWIWPLPAQVLQVTSFAPAAAPLPLQVSQTPILLIKTFRSAPKTDSVKEIWISTEMSRPRFSPLPPRWPPNMSPNRSPKSNWKPWPFWPAKLLKSKPPPKPPCCWPEKLAPASP